MAQREIELIDGLFMRFRPERVLEFGAGNSTLWWPPRLPFVREWVAVEHDHQYADAIRNQADEKVRVVLVLREKYQYVYPPSVKSKVFDMVLVDGIYRVACLEAASTTYLKPGGVAVLHDTARGTYTMARSFFDHHTILCEGEGVGQRWVHRGLEMFWNNPPRERDRQPSIYDVWGLTYVG